MIQILKKLFRLTPPANYKELLQRGATIVDVRTKEEYRHGNISGSLNIPLSQLKGKLSVLKKEKPVIVCCASGARSSSAKRVLTSNGFIAVYNAGSWMSLQNKIRK